MMRNGRYWSLFWSRSKKDDRAIKVLLVPVNTQAFKAFQVNVNNAGWQESPDKLIWTIKPGFNTLDARVLTRFGWPGTVSTIKLYYTRPWLFGREKRQEEVHGRYVKSI